MKRVLGLIFVFSLFLLACEKNEGAGVKVEEKIDYTKASIALMDSIRPELSGTWNMKEVNVSVFPPFTSDVGIKNDTTLNDFAVLDITNVDNSSQSFYLEHNDVTGVLKFKSKIYPVGFTMMSTPTRIAHKTGPQVFTLFEYRFKDGSHVTEGEESYLSNLSLMGENYSIEISPDGKTMVWKGLSRAIKRIYFVKR
jgi:hypothetical protein